MIKEILRFEKDNVRYVFLVDGRFSIAHASTGKGKDHRFMPGVAFCSREDRPDIVKGLHTALSRLCLNLRFTKEQRTAVHKELQERLSGVQEEARTLDEQIERLLRLVVGFDSEPG